MHCGKQRDFILPRAGKKYKAKKEKEEEKMKKIICALICAVMLMGVMCIGVFAESGDALAANVYVTVSDGSGSAVLAMEQIKVTDADGDGALTINDALICAHESKYEGGAEAGYASAESEWGLSLVKLWGVENGGSYGYYVNNMSAMGLSDKVNEGDVISAYVYTDTQTWSDTYCYFDIGTSSADEGDELTLTLSSVGFDENYAPVVLPVSGAKLTVNGKASDVTTDADGKATIKLEDAGECIISATSQTQVLVPPVCRVSVKAAEIQTEPQTEANTQAQAQKKSGCGSLVGMTGAIVLISVSFAGLAVVSKKKNEG